MVANNGLLHHMTPINGALGANPVAERGRIGEQMERTNQSTLWRANRVPWWMWWIWSGCAWWRRVSAAAVGEALGENAKLYLLGLVRPVLAVMTGLSDMECVCCKMRSVDLITHLSFVFVLVMDWCRMV